MSFLLLLFTHISPPRNTIFHWCVCIVNCRYISEFVFDALCPSYSLVIYSPPFPSSFSFTILFRLPSTRFLLYPTVFTSFHISPHGNYFSPFHSVFLPLHQHPVCTITSFICTAHWSFTIFLGCYFHFINLSIGITSPFVILFFLSLEQHSAWVTPFFALHIHFFLLLLPLPYSFHFFLFFSLLSILISVKMISTFLCSMNVKQITMKELEKYPNKNWETNVKNHCNK